MDQPVLSNKHAWDFEIIFVNVEKSHTFNSDLIVFFQLQISRVTLVLFVQ